MIDKMGMVKGGIDKRGQGGRKGRVKGGRGEGKEKVKGERKGSRGWERVNKY